MVELLDVDVLWVVICFEMKIVWFEILSNLLFKVVDIVFIVEIVYVVGVIVVVDNIFVLFVL